MADKRRAIQSLIVDEHKCNSKSPRLSSSDSDSLTSSPLKETSSPSSSDDDVPLHTSLWTRALMDKLGVVVRYKRSPESVIKEWSLSVLSEECLKEISAMLPKAASCFKNLDFDSIEEIKDAMKGDKLPTDLMKIVNFDTDFQYPGSQGASFGVRAEDFTFALACVMESLGEDEDTLEWHYQILFDKFLQMFGMKTMQQPFMTTKKSQVLGKEVNSQPDILCITSDPRKGRSVLVVCEMHKKQVKRNKTIDSTLDDSPPKKTLRSSVEVSSSVSSVIPDSLLAQHLGELFVYMGRSVSSRAILGMTVEQTNVRFTLLHVDENVLEKIKTSDGHGSVKFDTEEERPLFYYSKPLNYLKREDRLELMESLLQIRMMQKKFEQ